MALNTSKCNHLPTLPFKGLRVTATVVLISAADEASPAGF